MKKVSISILIILMSLLFVSFTNIDNSSSNLYLEDGSLYITDGNMSYKVSIKNNVYMMDGLDYSDTAVYILDDNVYIGIKTTYQEDIYTVEVMSLADNYTIFTTTDDTIYDYLTPLSEKVNFYSNLAQQITEYSWNFSENHYKDEQKPSIGTMSMDRNNRTIQQMTSTDSYLEGYKRMDIEHGYKITYQDPIINIVPESWLFTSGIKSYVGKEYAVIVNTIRQSETSTYGGPYYKSHVSVFDIEIGLLIKPDFADEDYYTDHSIYRSKRDIVWEIKPKFSNVYDSIRKSEMLQLSNWTRQFDITENQITISRSYDTTLQKYFIAPEYLAVSINSLIDANSSMTEDKSLLGILDVNYEFSLIPETLEKFMNRGSIISKIFDAVDIVTSTRSKLEIINKVNSCISNFYEQSQEDKYLKESENLSNNIMNYTKNFDKDAQDGKTVRPDNIVINVGDLVKNDTVSDFYMGVFDSPILENYYYKLTVNLDEKYYPISIEQYDKYFMDIYLLGKFKFYNSQGNLIDVINCEIDYYSQNIKVITNEYVSGEHQTPKAYTTNGFLTANLKLNNKMITTGIYSTYTGLVELMVYNYTTSSGFSVDVYDSEGKLVTSKGITRGDSLELIFNLEYDKLYAIKINSYGSLADVRLEINKITSTPTQIYGNFTFEVSTQDINKTVYLRFDLTKVGLYRFMSHTYNNPDIKIYDENCNLLQESYDTAEDDYNFNTVYYNKNNRSIIVEIYTHSADTFDVDIEYFSKWSGQ